MLNASHKLAIYVPGQLAETRGKMAHGVLRYSPHNVVCVIDPDHAGKTTGQVLKHLRHDVPIVATIADAATCQANVLILGVAPLGGRIPPDWIPVLQHAVASGFSITNGLHDTLADKLGACQDGQFIWDIRREPPGITSADGSASQLTAKRLLLVGSDMSVGKMTTGMELWHAAMERGIRTAFVATGQIGITICGSGIPLDAIRVDYAAGAVQAQVLSHADAELIIVEGQGSIFHPASTATLPLIRGTAPTHLLYCHRAGQTHIRDFPHLQLPPLDQAIHLLEDLASAGGAFPRPSTIGIALNSEKMPDEQEFQTYATNLSAQINLPTADPLRQGTGAFLEQLMQ